MSNLKVQLYWDQFVFLSKYQSVVNEYKFWCIISTMSISLYCLIFFYFYWSIEMCILFHRNIDIAGVNKWLLRLRNIHCAVILFFTDEINSPWQMLRRCLFQLLGPGVTSPRNLVGIKLPALGNYNSWGSAFNNSVCVWHETDSPPSVRVQWRTTSPMVSLSRK